MVKSWFRTIINEQKTSKDLYANLQELGYTLQEMTEDKLQTKIDNKQLTIGIVTLEKCYGIVGNTNCTKETYEYIKQLETTLKSVGYKIGYETRDDAIMKTRVGEVLATVTAPEITKQDVMDVTLAGEVFVHKATRHIIPARPLFVNVPLSWMNLDPIEGNKRLVDNLSKRKIKWLPPGQTFDRRYEEELYVFE
jgi:hypothetical protein